MGQAIVVTTDGIHVVPETADLIAWMEVRGHAITGAAKVGGRLRAELQGQPVFAGLVGPMWGGEDHPLRYEDPKTHSLMSM